MRSQGRRVDLKHLFVPSEASARWSSEFWGLPSRDLDQVLVLVPPSERGLLRRRGVLPLNERRPIPFELRRRSFQLGVTALQFRFLTLAQLLPVPRRLFVTVRRRIMRRSRVLVPLRRIEPVWAHRDQQRTLCGAVFAHKN
jgi:hypothetical protein